jgi:hypothetical protein
VISDIGTHARWQVDVRSVTFTSPNPRGVGAAYYCDTRLGPVAMRIPMEVIEWDEGRSIAVRYDGTLSGGGRISLRRRRRRRTQVTWSARLRFPWWLGGPVGATAAGQVLRVVWKKNLAALAREVER